MIYLETNSLRTLAKKLSDPTFIKDKYTSILAIIELLSGVRNENEYQKRRGIITKIINSDIYNRIHPLLPATILYNAFGCNINDNKVCYGIIRLLKIIDYIPNYSDFMNYIKDGDFNTYFDFTQKFDDLSNVFFIGFMEDKSKDGNTKVLIPEFKARWEDKDFDSILDRLVRYFASKISINIADERSVERLIASYDKTINPFLLATSYYIDQKVSSKDNIAKNDAIDLLHLLYISETEIIVSDDMLINKILSIAYPLNIIKSSDLK